VSLLSVHDLSVRIGARTLVDGVDLDVGNGELIGLIGPNGAGKSTVIKAIVGLVAHRGEVLYRGEQLARLSSSGRARAVSYLSQENQVQWPITVRELVELGRYPHRIGWGGRWETEAVARAAEADGVIIERALRAADVWELRSRRADQLSGGERARARLARVLAVGAPLLLADEPVAALDPRHQLEVMALLRGHCDAGGGAIVVLHDLTLASRFCDRLVLLHRGRRVAAGAIQAVLSAERLHSVYGVEAVTGRHAGQHYVVPWACTTSGGEPS
jgi:iron complex transport system ATP-binding protein